MRILARCFLCKSKITLSVEHIYLMQSTRYEHHPIRIFATGILPSYHLCHKVYEFCAEFVISPSGKALNWNIMEPAYYPTRDYLEEVDLPTLKQYIQDFVGYTCGRGIHMTHTPKNLFELPRRNEPVAPTVSGTQYYYPGFNEFILGDTITTTTNTYSYEIPKDLIIDRLNAELQTIKQNTNLQVNTETENTTIGT